MNNTGSGTDTNINEAKDADSDEVEERLERDIEEIRDNLGNLVGELDHRRHEVFNVRLQLRRHGWPLAIGVAAVAGLLSGIFVWRRSRRPQYPRLARRWKDVRQALALAAGQPRPEPKKKPSVPKQIAGAAGASLASVVARRLAERFIQKPHRQTAARGGRD